MKALTAAEMREVDRLTTERLGVSGLQLMEAAGKSVVDVFLENMAGAARHRSGECAYFAEKGITAATDL